MITNISQAAAPTGIINSEQAQLVYFGVGSVSQTSQTFTVDQQPFYLSAYNLGSDDIITVQQVFGQGSGTEVASFAPVNGAVTLNQARTKVRIDHPGRYQLFHTGSSALGTFTVAGGAAVMTGDPLGDLSEALYQIFTTLGNSSNVTVVAPITLTGNGSPSLPYNIGFEAGTIIGSSTITITGSGTTADPYVVSLNDTVQSVFVEGTSPITVSGNGTPATPYNVGLSSSSGASPPDFVKIQTEAPILISGDGSSGNPYQIVPIPAYIVASGTDTYTASAAGLTVYFGGLVITVQFPNANTGAATLNINSLGAVDIQRRKVDVTAGQIPANSSLQLAHDGVRFQIVGAA